MKAALVTETFDPEVNGVAMTLGHLSRGLTALGHEVTVLAPSRPDRDLNSLSPKIRYLPVRGMPIPRYTGLRFGVPALRVLRYAWRNDRPDWVHVATEGPLGWSAVRVARHLGIPVVSSYHTNFQQYGGHYGLRFARRPVDWWLRRLHNQTMLTFVPSTNVLNRLQSSGVRNLRVMGRGVDLRQFDPGHRCARLRSEWGVFSDEPVALYVGRIAAEKNLQLVFQSWEQMKRRFDEPVRLVVVGDGPQRDEWQRHYPEVVFAGMRHGNELARHYASADILLFPSETETFGNVVTEAMASGLIVVAYHYAAAGAYIHNGVSGLTAPPGDTQAFIRQAISALCAADGASMRNAARDAVQQLSWDSVVDGYWSDVRSVLPIPSRQTSVEPSK